jgi:hypothetical protein
MHRCIVLLTCMALMFIRKKDTTGKSRFSFGGICMLLLTCSQRWLLVILPPRTYPVMRCAFQKYGLLGQRISFWVFIERIGPVNLIIHLLISNLVGKMHLRTFSCILSAAVDRPHSTSKTFAKHAMYGEEYFAKRYICFFIKMKQTHEL